MYLINQQSGQVIRVSDGVVVSPAQTSNDPNFVAYSDWVAAGNVPTIIENTQAGSVPNTLNTKSEWMSRFTDQELAVIYTAAKQSVAVEIWLERFKVAEYIDASDPRTSAGVHALESAGILAPGRALEILG